MVNKTVCALKGIIDNYVMFVVLLKVLYAFVILFQVEELLSTFLVIQVFW